METSTQCIWCTNYYVGDQEEDIINNNSETCREEVEEFFDSMDRDYDGKLSFEEFMGEESPIEKLFKNMDRNGDGLVTKQVRVNIKQKRRSFSMFQEFLTICKNLSDEEVKIAFEKFDTSGDDKLDYREFCMMINNNRRDQDM